MHTAILYTSSTADQAVNTVLVQLGVVRHLTRPLTIEMVGIWCRPASPYGMLQLPLFDWVYVASYALGVCLLSRAHPIRLGLYVGTREQGSVVCLVCPLGR